MLDFTAWCGVCLQLTSPLFSLVFLWPLVKAPHLPLFLGTTRSTAYFYHKNCCTAVKIQVIEKKGQGYKLGEIFQCEKWWRGPLKLTGHVMEVRESEKNKRGGRSHPKEGGEQRASLWFWWIGVHITETAGCLCSGHMLVAVACAELYVLKDCFQVFAVLLLFWT